MDSAPDSVLALYEEDMLEQLLEIARKHLVQPDFGRNLEDLVKLSRIEGVPNEVSEEILRVARHVRKLRAKHATR